VSVRLLGIDFSPREGSNSGLLLEASFERLAGARGDEVVHEVIHLRDLHLETCQYCDVCGKTKSGQFVPCIMAKKDDVQSVLDAMVAADGTPLGSPYAWTFSGMARPIVTMQQRGKMGLVDLSSDPIMGGITVDRSGDWAPDDGGLTGTRKRCLRRVVTLKNSFAHLQGYGLNYDIKQPATTNKLATLRTDVQGQEAQEPDVAAVQTQIGMDVRGYLSIGLKCQTKTGQSVAATITNTPLGITVQ